MRHKWSFQMLHGKANVFLAMWDCRVACSRSPPWRVSIAVWQMAPAFSDSKPVISVTSLSELWELRCWVVWLGVTCWLWADVGWGWRSSESLTRVEIWLWGDLLMWLADCCCLWENLSAGCLSILTTGAASSRVSPLQERAQLGLSWPNCEICVHTMELIK